MEKGHRQHEHEECHQLDYVSQDRKAQGILSIYESTECMTKAYHSSNAVTITNQVFNNCKDVSITKKHIFMSSYNV